MINSNQIQLQHLEDGRIDYNAPELRKQIDILISFGYDHAHMLSALTHFIAESMQGKGHGETHPDDRFRLCDGVQSIRSMSDKGRELAKLLQL